MATFTLTVPDDVLRRARARLGGNGRADVKEYLLSSLQALALEDEPLDKETEAKLLEGLNSPLEKMTARDWKDLRARVNRHRKR